MGYSQICLLIIQSSRKKTYSYQERHELKRQELQKRLEKRTSPLASLCSCNVSPAMRQEIEETLLLPANIKKCDRPL